MLATLDSGPPSLVCTAGWVLALMMLGTRAVAQTLPPQLEAEPLAEGERVVIDGHLDEGAWVRAEGAGDFVERSPHPGRRPTADTRVRVLVDGDALYFGVECALAADEAPRGLERTRDSPEIWNDDAISVKVDTRRDRRTTLGFVVNAAGAQLDYLALDNGRVVRTEIDAVWESAVSVADARWTVEMRIPVVALGAGAGRGERAMGLQITRDHNATTSIYDWAATPPEVGAFSALHYGILRGLGPLGGGGGVPIAVTPYALGSLGWRENAPREARTAAGGEVQMRLASDVWLEASLLTDFSEVDLDDPRVNLDRFPLFFPERRPFFLGGLDVFDFGLEEQLQPFYSRRIGLDASGGRLPVLGGVKLFGREGDVSFGLLDVVTGSDDGTDAANQLAARARWAPDGGASYVGAIVVGRQPFAIDGPPVEARGVHTTVGADALWRTLEDRFEVSGFVTATTREGPDVEEGESGEGIAAQAGARYLGEWAQPELSLLWVERSYAPDVGFARRPGVGRLSGNVPLVARPAGFGVRQLSLNVGGEMLASDDFEELVYVFGGFEATVTGDDGWEAGVSGDYIEDVVAEPFEATDGVVIEPGRYNGALLEAWFESSPQRNPAIEVYYGISNAYFGGTLHNAFARVSVSLEGWARLLTWADVYYAELPGAPGFWTYGLYGLLRVTPATNLQIDLVARIDDDARVGTGLFRVRWRFAPGSDLWLVHRTDASYADASGPSFEHTTTLKLTVRFDAML